MAATPQQLSGRFVVDVALARATRVALQELALARDAFVDAVDLGMFPPAALRGRSPAQSRHPGGVARAFQADDVPRYAFGVLAGMISHIEQAISKVDHSAAFELGDPGVNLLHNPDPPPALPDPLPAMVQLDLRSQRTTPPLVVEIEFTRAVSDPAQRKLYCDQLTTWSRLLQGGYSATGTLGEAAITTPSVRFLDPSTVHLAADQWLGVRACFVPLLALVLRWTSSTRVTSVQISDG